GLLPYIPLPNVPGTDIRNFHFVTTAVSDSDDINLRLNRSFGAASTQRRGQNGSGGGAGGRGGPFRGGRHSNNLSIGIHYHGSSSTQTNPFPSVSGSSDNRSLDIPFSYTRSFGKITNRLSVDFNRSRIRTHNIYAGVTDITGTLGINGVSTNPFDW